MFLNLTQSKEDSSKYLCIFLARRRCPLLPPLGKKDKLLRGSIFTEYLSLKVQKFWVFVHYGYLLVEDSFDYLFGANFFRTEFNLHDIKIVHCWAFCLTSLLPLCCAYLHLFVYFMIYFDASASISEHIAMNYRKLNIWLERRMNRFGCGLTWNTMLAFVCRD